MSTMSPKSAEIRALRLYCALTPAQAADLIQDSSQNWVKWETGADKMPSLLWERFLRETSRSQAKPPPGALPEPLPPDHPSQLPLTLTTPRVPGRTRGTWIAVRPAPSEDAPDRWQWVCLQCRAEVAWDDYATLGRPRLCRGNEWLKERLAQMPTIKDFGPDDQPIFQV